MEKVSSYSEGGGLMKRWGSDVLALIALLICILIIVYCSVVGYQTSYQKGMEHFDEDVKVYATDLFIEWKDLELRHEGEEL